MKTSAVFVSAAALAALGVGGMLTSQALADSPSPSPTATSTTPAATSSGTSTTATQQNGNGYGRGMSRHADGQGMGRSMRGGGMNGGGMGGGVMGPDAEALATKLGLDATTVQKAIQEVHQAQRPAERPATRPTDEQREERRAAFIKALATKLGVSESKLTSAIDALQAEHQAQRATEMKSRLDQAVKDGTLTQTEADAVLKAIKAGVLGGGRR